MPARSSALARRIEALYGRSSRGMVLGLERMREGLAALGDPHQGLACVHVTGSNGKGSTCAMVESIAREAGLRTGLYTSPHLSRLAERIRIGGEPIDDAAFERALGAPLDLTAGAAKDLTFFELMTIAAFVAFREARVDLAVIEVGLGGRLDATNVIEAPLATAITSIALEHTEVLGGTLALIAEKKAGILKRGAPVVLGPLDAEAHRVIEEAAVATQAGPILRAAREGEPSRKLGLRGPFQAENAAVAAVIARVLAERWPAIRGAIDAGLSRAQWPGRFERMSRHGISVIFDCAHNPHAAAALARALSDDGVDPASTSLVFGALADKEWRAMLGTLAPLSRRRYYACPKGRAPVQPGDLQAIATGEGFEAPGEALGKAFADARPGDTVLVTGSTYLVAEARAALLSEAIDEIVAL